MLLGVCGAMAGVYDGIVAVPRRGRALYVATPVTTIGKYDSRAFNKLVGGSLSS